MTSRIQKRLLLPKRVRHPPREGFSWVDRRFLKDYAARLSRDAILLYFCKRPTNPFLSGSVVWSPVSSGFQIPPDEVFHERVGAVVA